MTNESFGSRSKWSFRRAAVNVCHFIARSSCWWQYIAQCAWHATVCVCVCAVVCMQAHSQSRIVSARIRWHRYVIAHGSLTRHWIDPSSRQPNGQFHFDEWIRCGVYLWVCRTSTHEQPIYDYPKAIEIEFIRHLDSLVGRCWNREASANRTHRLTAPQTVAAQNQVNWRDYFWIRTWLLALATDALCVVTMNESPSTLIYARCIHSVSMRLGRRFSGICRPTRIWQIDHAIFCRITWCAIERNRIRVPSANARLLLFFHAIHNGSRLTVTFLKRKKNSNKTDWAVD